MIENLDRSGRASRSPKKPNLDQCPGGNSQVRALLAIGLALFLTILPAFAANAAVLTDPSLFTGGSAIDPSGAEAIDFVVSGSTAEATLEARSDFWAVHDFTGFAAGTTNIISFTDSTRPDIEFSQSGSFSATQSGADSASANLATSGGSALVLRNTAASTTLTLTIDFGSWNGSVFDGSVNSVQAAAFTLPNAYAGITHTVTFLTNDNIVLFSRTFAGASSTDSAGNHRDIYIGFESSAFDIGKITIARSTDSSGTFSTGFDDLGFTTVPEPHVGGLLAVGLGMQLLLRRTRRGGRPR